MTFLTNLKRERLFPFFGKRYLFPRKRRNKACSQLLQSPQLQCHRSLASVKCIKQVRTRSTTLSFESAARIRDYESFTFLTSTTADRRFFGEQMRQNGGEICYKGKHTKIEFIKILRFNSLISVSTPSTVTSVICDYLHHYENAISLPDSLNSSTVSSLARHRRRFSSNS